MIDFSNAEWQEASLLWNIINILGQEHQEYFRRMMSEPVTQKMLIDMGKASGYNVDFFMPKPDEPVVPPTKEPESEPTK